LNALMSREPKPAAHMKPPADVLLALDCSAGLSARFEVRLSASVAILKGRIFNWYRKPLPAVGAVENRTPFLVARLLMI
jgi:hypothetical protein